MGSDGFKLANQGVEIAVHQFAAAGFGIKVAIATLWRAKWHMNVKTGNGSAGRGNHERKIMAIRLGSYANNPQTDPMERSVRGNVSPACLYGGKDERLNE